MNTLSKSQMAQIVNLVKSKALSDTKVSEAWMTKFDYESCKDSQGLYLSEPIEPGVNTPTESLALTAVDH